jgi:hypothetical protein
MWRRQPIGPSRALYPPIPTCRMTPDFKPHEQLIPRCLRKDQHRLRLTLDRLRHDARSGKNVTDRPPGTADATLGD